MKSWNVIEALQVIREAWSSCELAGYHVALTGSVLLRGSSNDDLDLVLYPRHSLHTDYRTAIMALQLALKSKRTPTVVKREAQTNYKLVVTIHTDDDRRVDVFVPNFTFEGRLDNWDAVNGTGSSSEELEQGAKQ